MLRALIVTDAIGVVIGFGWAPTVSAEPQPSSPPATGRQYSFDSDLPLSPVSQQNAVSKAQQYLNYTSFSRQGLIHQFEYDGISTEDARYVAVTIAVDWNQQAVKKGQQYLNYTSCSRQGLIQQLEYD